MNLKRLFSLVVLALVHLPMTALASDADTFSCGTIYPFWWRYDGPRTSLAVKCLDVQPVGNSFLVAFSVENQGSELFDGGMDFTLTHAAVDPAGYADPASPTPPASPRSLLGTQTLERGTLPMLRPGEQTVMQAYIQGFTGDANHILTVIFHARDQVQLESQYQPSFWLRILSPTHAPGALVLSTSRVERVSSTLNGYMIHRVRVVLRNVSQQVLAAGTPISMSHGGSGFAGGYWGPDDVVDPNDPGNPYASFFREVLFQGRLSQPMLPGQEISIEGLAHEPEGVTSFQQVTVAVGQ